MLFKDITVLDDHCVTKQHQYVGIMGDKIQYIGDKMPQTDYGEMYEGKNKLLMSGFYNTHAHTPMMPMRGYGENLMLQDWLNQRIFPFEAELNGNTVYYSMLLGIAESLRFGIVSTTDMYYFCDDMVKAVIESGVKNNIGRGLTNFTDQDLDSLPAFQETKSLFEQYHKAADGRIIVDVSLHAEYTSNPKTVEQLANYMNSVGAGMHVHVSETTLEHEECKQRHDGLTPVRYLNQYGVFDTRATAAHCVWVDEEDMEILSQKGVTVASCPISNMKLSSGVCNVPALLKKGINVAIGTDSVASNNSLNFIEEMKFFAIANKEKRADPTLITPQETIYAATTAGAKSQGREDCGKLAVGMKADLIVLDLSQPNMYPIHNLANNIVYSASGSDILLTMVDGKVLYKNGEYLTIDVEKAIFETEKETARILTELKKGSK